MWLPFLGLIVGILFGSIFTFAVPVIFAKYLSVAVLAGLDSLMGGYRAVLEEKFDGAILISGFFANALFAAGLAYLGDLLGLDLYLAAVIAFGLRLFSNISFIRRHLIDNYRKKKADRETALTSAAEAAASILPQEAPVLPTEATTETLPEEAKDKPQIIEQSILSSKDGLGNTTKLKDNQSFPSAPVAEEKTTTV